MKGGAFLAWLCAAIAGAAVQWPSLFCAARLIPGGPVLSESRVGIPVALVSLAIAAFLSVPRLQSRERLLICVGVVMCLFGVLGVYVSSGFALVFGFIAVSVLNETKRAA